MFTKEDFLAVFDEKIKRDGASELRKYLLSSDFFTAPASSRYHCAYEGGLCEHCLNVYYRLLDNVKKEYGETWQEIVSEETSSEDEVVDEGSPVPPQEVKSIANNATKDNNFLFFIKSSLFMFINHIIT